MNVQFISPNPRERARPLLDQVLSSGTDQLAIASAFLTPGGVEMLTAHAARLRHPDSFVVVAWGEPTTLEALNRLHAMIPGRLYVHLGSKTPWEKGVGAALMHSKVFLAKGGGRCRLWTGSHNLTASAMQGVNCEAAVLLEGTPDEPAFIAAMEHLHQCRAEAILFDPLNPPPPLDPDQTLVIHAECYTGLKNPPWFVHVMPDNTAYDKAMRPPAAVWLYLYDPGTLHPGRVRPPAAAAYSGTLTALNFTERHPRHRGISADWQRADFVIELPGTGVPRLINPVPHTNAPSQGIFRVETLEDHRTVWLTESPAPRLERVVGVQRYSPVDPQYRKFFTKSSVSGVNLVHQEYRDLKTVVRLPRKEVGSIGTGELQTRLESQNLSETRGRTEIVIDEKLKRKDIFAFVYRAKFRA